MLQCTRYLMSKALLNFIFNKTIILRKSKIESRRQDVKILRPTDCNVIGLKLAGSFVSPFLWIKMVQAFFHSEGIQPEDQMFLISSSKTERRYGQPHEKQRQLKSQPSLKILNNNNNNNNSLHTLFFIRTKFIRMLRSKSV